MNKLILLLLSVTLVSVSCSKDDDGEKTFADLDAARSVIVGTWEADDIASFGGVFYEDRYYYMDFDDRGIWKAGYYKGVWEVYGAYEVFPASSGNGYKVRIYTINQSGEIRVSRRFPLKPQTYNSIVFDTRQFHRFFYTPAP